MNDETLDHRQTWDLIPWVVNGSASAAERELVDEHLRSCENCRDEFAFQSQVHAGMRVQNAMECDSPSAFKRLLGRIDVESASDANSLANAATYAAAHVANPLPVNAAPSRSRWGRNRGRLLAAIVLAQSVGLVVLGILLLAPERLQNSSAAYVTLSRVNAVTAVATIRFVPDPSLTVGAMQAMLADAKLRIVESNQGSSIYGLAAEPDAASGASDPASAQSMANTAAAVARLRQQHGVLLVEPIVLSQAARDK